MYSLDEYDLNDFKYEDMVLFVASTFGNGDPPTNGEVRHLVKRRGQ